MSRPILTTLIALALAGCASQGNYYRYDTGGDYYTGASGPDVVLQSSPYYGGFGYSHGFGYGPGFGYGFGHGYGYNYGAYSPWGFGYPPIYWWPDYSVDNGALRQNRVERERSERSALVWRPTVAAPRNMELDAWRRGQQPPNRFDRQANDSLHRPVTGFQDSRPARVIRTAPQETFSRSSDSAPGMHSGGVTAPMQRMPISQPVPRNQ